MGDRIILMPELVRTESGSLTGAVVVCSFYKCDEMCFRCAVHSTENFRKWQAIQNETPKRP